VITATSTLESRACGTPAEVTKNVIVSGDQSGRGGRG
jgi:hypothetical protein